MTVEATSPGVGRRITRYGAMLAFSGALCHILRLVYTVLAINILGEERFGRIEYFIEMAVIFTVLIDFGLEQTITREIARRRERLADELPSLLGYRALTTALGGLVMVAFLAAAAKPVHTWGLIAAATFYYAIVSIMMLVRAISRSYEWMALEGLAGFLDKFAHISVALVVLILYQNLPLLILCYSLGTLVSVVLYSTLIYRHISIGSSKVNLMKGWDWQKLAAPIGLSAACIMLLHRQDTAMVNWIRGDAETGLYRAPYRFLEGLFLVPQVIAVSAYPVFSKLFHDKQPFARTASTFIRGLLMISLPLSVGGTMLGHEMMIWMAPNLGREGGDVFVILVWSLSFIYLNFLLGTLLNATDRQTRNLNASAWSMGCNLILNVPAIYYAGAYGASAMTVASQGLYTLLMIWHTRDLRMFTEGKRYLSIAGACIIMAAALAIAPWNWIIEVFIGAAVYFMALLMLGGLTQDDRNKIKQLLLKK